MSKTFPINKGVNNPIEFKGLKAQYVAYLAAGLLGLLLLFALLYFIDIPVIVCLLIILAAGTALFTWVMRFSSKYGEYGLMKQAAWRKTPPCLRSRKRLFHKQDKNTDTWK